jgi:hypothetical protein
MQLSGKYHFGAVSKIPIHNIDASEIGFTLEVIRTHHLHHPVQHPRAEQPIDFVGVQEPAFVRVPAQCMLNIMTIDVAVFFGKT